MEPVKSNNDLRSEIHQLVDATKDDGILMQVRALLNAEGEQWWNEEAESLSFELSDADIAAGRIKTHEDAMEEMRVRILERVKK